MITDLMEPNLNHFSSGLLTKTSLCSSVQDNKDLELDIMPASLTDDPEVKLRDPNHEVNEEKRKSARKKE